MDELGLHAWETRSCSDPYLCAHAHGCLYTCSGLLVITGYVIVEMDELRLHAFESKPANVNPPLGPLRHPRNPRTRRIWISVQSSYMYKLVF